MSAPYPDPFNECRCEGHGYYCPICRPKIDANYRASELTTASLVLKSLSPEERLDLFSKFCRGCGNPTPPICHCENDE